MLLFRGAALEAQHESAWAAATTQHGSNARLHVRRRCVDLAAPQVMDAEVLQQAVMRATSIPRYGPKSYAVILIEMWPQLRRNVKEAGSHFAGCLLRAVGALG